MPVLFHLREGAGRDEKMKRFLALAMGVMMAAAVSAPAFAEEAAVEIPADMKVGFIFLHDENSTYDLNFINAAKEAAANLGMSEDQIILKTNVPEGQECYDEAADMADAGCSVVFADSFGHEDFMIQAGRRADGATNTGRRRLPCARLPPARSSICRASPSRSQSRSTSASSR